MENNPVSLYWDEASIGYEAYSVSETGSDMHGNDWLQPIYPAYGDYKAPVYIWLTALILKIYPVSQTAVRLPSVILGSLSILLVYFLSRELIGKERRSYLPLFVAVAMAVLPWHIHFSRVGFEANVGLFFVIFSLWMLLKARMKSEWLIMAVISGALGIYSYFSIRLVLPLMWGCTVIIFWKSYKKRWLHLLLAFIGLILLMVPMFRSPYYAISNQYRLSTENVLRDDSGVLRANALRNEDGYTLVSRILHHRYWERTRELVTNVFDHLSFDYLFMTGDSNLRHSSRVSGLMLLAMAPAFAVGLASLTKKKRLFALVLAWWLVALIPASIPEETPHALRSLNAIVPIVIILGSGVDHWYRKFFKKGKLLVAVYLYLFLLAGQMAGFLSYYFLEYPRVSALEWQDGYKQLANLVKNRYKEYNSIMVTNIDRLYLYVLYFNEIPPDITQSKFKISEKEEYYLDEFDKFTFKSIQWDSIKSETNDETLLIDKAKNIPTDVVVRDWIYDSGGNKVYGAVEARKL